MSTTAILDSVRGEFLRYRSLAEAAIAQMDEGALSAPGPNGGNSVAVLCWHLSGNLRSRFTDFLTSDGEKPWRRREEEFEQRRVTRSELIAHWEQGWEALLGALQGLTDEDLQRTVTIRGEPFRVHEALHRSLAHVSYHVGQIVYLAKASAGAGWSYLSIPPGGSDRYNQSPGSEKPTDHAAALKRSSGPRRPHSHGDGRPG